MKKYVVSALILLSAAVAVLTACLVAGVGRQPAAPAAAEKPRHETRAAVAEVPGAVERALRKRIRQLEAELAAARGQVQAPTNGPARPEVRPMAREGEFRPPNPREMMENLRKNDPKRYEEMRKRFARMRQRQLERTKGRLDFLESVDTSGMTKDERANHEKLQELLAQRENLPDPGEQTDEEMRESMQQRHELDRAIRQASADERKTLLRQTANALGLEGDEAALLTETVQEVISATESDRHGPHGPPPGGAPGGGTPPNGK